MNQNSVSLRLPVGRKSVTVCRFRRLPIIESINGFRRVVGRGDWQVAHELVRVRTVEPESAGMRESFSDPMAAAVAKKAPLVVLQTDTHFEFWDVASNKKLFIMRYEKVAAVLDAWVAAGQVSIKVSTLRAALDPGGS